MRRTLAGVFLACLTALGQGSPGAPLEAILVVQEEVLEDGELRTYTGAKRYPVSSEGELKALLKGLSRPPRPPRFVFQEGKWRGVEKKGLAFDEKEALAAYREALAQGKKASASPRATRPQAQALGSFTPSGCGSTWPRAKPTSGAPAGSGPTTSSWPLPGWTAS